MDILTAILLGIIQGVTEWLPISSSGHLALAQILMDQEPPIFFDVMLHFGTLCAVLLYFRDDALRLLKGLFKGPEQERQTVLMLIIAMVPVLMVGFLLEEQIEDTFRSTKAVAVGLLITTAILFPTMKFYGGKGKLEDYKPKSALVVGLAQALSILPGVSRSGSTIATGMYQDFDREAAARFSFLLSIPTIMGVVIYELIKLAAGEVQMDVPTIAGTITAFTVGYLAISTLLKVIQKKGFHYFAIYTLALGLFFLVY